MYFIITCILGFLWGAGCVLYFGALPTALFYIIPGAIVLGIIVQLVPDKINRR
jgi:hypothetical protein